MKKSSYLFALVMAIVFAALPGAGAEIDAKFTNAIQGLGTRETATRRIDGLTVIYPVDEADVVDLLTEDIRGYRTQRQGDSRAEVDAVMRLLSGQELREKYRSHIAEILGLDTLDPTTFGMHYDAALKQVRSFLERWERWSGDLSSLRFWNRLTARDYERDGTMVFPEISFQPPAEGGDVQVKITPPYLTSQTGAELIAPLDGPGVASESRPAFRLDIPLIYSPGTSARDVAQKASDLLSRIPDMLRSQVSKLARAAQQGLMELLLRSTIRSEYFPKDAAPKSEVLINALARYYMIVAFKASDELKPADEQAMLDAWLALGPKDKAVVAGMGARDPFSGGPAAPESAMLQTAESRLVLVTLMKLGQGGAGDGLPIFQKLRKAGQMPKGGFAGVAEFTAAVEATYPARFHKVFSDSRSEMVASAGARLAKSEGSLKPMPEDHAGGPPMPNRETLDFEGLSFSFPPALRAAVAKLAPEIAEARKRAAAKIAERAAAGASAAPARMPESTLEYLRSFGLTIPRNAADFDTAGAAVMARSEQMFAESALGWKKIQIWFKDDLKGYLAKGGEVTGFTYDPGTDALTFEFQGKAPMAKSPEGLMAGAAAAVAAPHAPMPIVLTDRRILDLKDPGAQAALLREKDKVIFPVLESAANGTNAELGLPEKAGEGSRDADETFFVTVHELVEADLIRQVIASDDRRWFCEGMANLLAIRAYDHQFGTKNGHSGFAVFQTLFDPAVLGTLASQVELFDWAPVGSEPENLKSNDRLTGAHYYFATLVLLRATEGQSDDFIKQWIAKIRETPWNRTNIGTVIDAYDQLTGKSLRKIIESTVVGP